MMRFQKKYSKNLIITVFNETTAPRSFEVSLQWIHRVGILAMFFTMCGLLSFAWAFKMSWLNSRKMHAASAVLPIAPAPASLVLGSVVPLEVQKKTAVSSETFIADTALQQLDEPQSKIPLTLENFKTKTNGHTLFVKFAIAVQKEKGELHFQGKIVVIAKGNGIYLVYPEMALSENIDKPIIASKGESFSVSRYREVNAEFYLPLQESVEIHSIETLLYGKEQELLLKHIWKIED